ncbi:MAG: hypothetical protein AAF927_19150 [Bacteroidota bacterium]
MQTVYVPNILQSQMLEKSKILTTYVLLLFVGIQTGFACECIPLSTQAKIDSADIVFDGTVIYVNTNWMSGGMKYTFQVHQSWKRRTDTVMVINSGFATTDCGYTFEEGQRYLVFARKKFSFKTDACAGNMLIADATNYLSKLGQSQKPSQSSLVPLMYWTLSGLTVFALAFMAFIVLRKRKTPTQNRS